MSSVQLGHAILDVMKLSLFQWELLVLASGVIIFLVMLFPALQHARRDARDGQRREAALEAKRELEDMYNRQESYPLVHDPAGDVSYAVTEMGENEALGWYVRIPLEHFPEQASGFDLEYNVFWRVVRDGAAAFYDICGGTDTCGADKQQRGE